MSEQKYAGRPRCDEGSMICPYFHASRDRTLRNVIMCEGCLSALPVTHRFSSGQAQRRHILEFCATFEYRRCRYARLMDAAYAACD